jgi:hypothetical protein
MSEPMREVSPEDVAAAAKRYPGMPGPLAIARYMMDEMAEGNLAHPLRPGMAWGGLHGERLGFMFEKLAESVYNHRQKAITVKLVAQDYPFDYDHWGLEVVKVDDGHVGGADAEPSPVAGWPCCSCDETIKPHDHDAAVVLLGKKAKWEYPSWGAILDTGIDMPGGLGGRASAVLCGKCCGKRVEPRFAIKREGDKYIRVPVEELEDLNGNSS